MPEAATPVDQTITNNSVLANDPYLTIPLPGGFLYRVFSYFVWSQANSGFGGVKVGLVSDVAADMTWAAPDSGSSMQALNSGDSLSINGVAGNHAVTIFGSIRTSALAHLSVQRSQAATNANPTTIRKNSILIATVVNESSMPPALSVLPVFTAPLITQNLNVPIPSPLGATVLVGPTSTGVIAARPTRRGIAFCNPNPTGTIFVIPSNQSAVNGQGIPIFPGAFLPIMGGDEGLINVTTGWNAITDGGSNVPLTILEFV